MLVGVVGGEREREMGEERGIRLWRGLEGILKEGRES